jgi:diguanylate cyclase (GGDEF)-like protein/PAS domain S-box-containing protein
MLTRSNDRLRLESALQSASRAVVVTDSTQPDNPIIFVNAAFTALTGYEPKDAVGRNCRFLQGPETDPGTVAEIGAALLAGVSIRRDILNYRRDGEAFWNDLSIDPIRGEDGSTIGFIGIQFDCTPKHQALEAASDAQQRLRDVMANVPGYFYRRVLLPNGELKFPYLSPSFYQLLGLPEASGEGDDIFFETVHPDDRAGFLKSIQRSAANLSMFREEFRLVTASKRVVWFRSDAQPRQLLNGEIVWDGVGLDITSEKVAESELAFLSLHDPLTGLANRSHFKDAVSDAARELLEDQKLAIFSLDIHRLQEINDGLGQGVGDEVLQEIGRRLQALADAEWGVAGRLGGDEFAILIPRAASESAVAALASNISNALARPITVDGADLVIQTCIGATFFPTLEDNLRDVAAGAPAELIKRADVALRAAKEEGPGAYCVYAAGSDDRVRHRAALRQSLHRAVEDSQLELHYQPLVDLGSGRIVGAEALIRWNHPRLGLQRPDLFIPMAEESGLIVPMGAWAMTDAMRQRQTWASAGLNPPRIAINVSSVQLRKPDFLAVVERALADTGADPRLFEFELTEGLLIEPSPEVLTTLTRLRALGFWITIDDFGTGHATFKYLRDFPVDKIKIDQTFVRSLVVDSSDASIVRAMIGLARNLDIQIVAEGIETHMQRRFLRTEGCTVGQGYLFSPPMKAEDFGWLIENKAKLPFSKEIAPRTRGLARESDQTKKRGRLDRE